MSMNTQKVIKKAMEDEEFAKELKAKALLAFNNGVDSKEFEEFMKYFPVNPDELGRMRSNSHEGRTRGTTTTTTVTTAACVTTTTTTDI